MPRRRFGMLVGAFFSCAGLLLVSLSAAPETSSATEKRSVGQIAQEQLDVATKGYKLALQRYKQGLGGVADTSEWLRRRALAAQEFPNPADRVAALQENVRQLNENLTRMEQAVKAGTANPEDLLVAQYDELEGELWLAKAKEKH